MTAPGGHPPGSAAPHSADRELFTPLLAQRVPEVANGTIRIVDAVRYAGYYAKVAVTATVEGVNAASACIGPRGSRIHDVEALIPGERISVVNYDPDPVRYVANALDVEIDSVTVTSIDLRDIRAVVSVDHFATAIGRGARNVRLASALTGWRIAICTARCTARRHVHPRFDNATGVSVWDPSVLTAGQPEAVSGGRP
ncbi:transcription elongation factor NusA [Candidatus Mycobacterium methanotrophicum]|uniref:Transcription elongation factor NusA n=1 Tax=Candidatus Mycobacterium methanotrophicum TaxID=2943498 RepID=A0ABY4QU82_9MYCO|nr:transcription elongation factor NusA [Candidatus Mycobacterium methanotrophicum]UQX13548.1 transcription elongation factor NusA [Candidatus Mycobacterium methanotrophicum]